MTFIKLLTLPIILSSTMVGMKEANDSSITAPCPAVCFVTDSALNDVKANSVSLETLDQVSSTHSFPYAAYAFDKDELRANLELAKLANEIYSSSKLVYLYGSDVSTEDFSDLISHEPYVFDGSNWYDASFDKQNLEDNLWEDFDSDLPDTARIYNFDINAEITSSCYIYYYGENYSFVHYISATLDDVNAYYAGEVSLLLSSLE